MRAFVEQRKVDTHPKIAKSDKLATLVFSKFLPQIRDLLTEHAQVHVNFWGQRRVTFGGLYRGSISLDRVAKEIHAISRRCCDAQDLTLEDLTLEDRLAGLDTVRSIEALYKTSDRQLKITNLRTLITRVLNWIREFTFWPYIPRFDIEGDRVRMCFRGYSKEGYEGEGFGNAVQDSTSYKIGSFRSAGGIRYCPAEVTLRDASAEALRARLAEG